MDYCNLSDIQAEVQRIPINATSQPSSTQVTAWCGEISADMDALFEAVGATLPVTDPAKLKMLKVIAINGVVARVYRSIEAESETAEMFQGLYDNALKKIRNNPAMLAVGTTYESPSHGFGSNVERKFKREERVW